MKSVVPRTKEHYLQKEVLNAKITDLMHDPFYESFCP